jgi:diacylglycerol kinase (ATP)
MNQSPYKGKTGLQRIWNALHYSLQGFRSAYEHESAFRQELFLGVILAVAAVAMPVSRIQLGLLLASLLLVLITELLNSAIEAVVDRVSFENHELAKRAKDMGSAAVFLSLANCLLIWALVLMDVLQTHHTG